MSPENPPESQTVPVISATIKCGIGPPARLMTYSLIVIVPVVVGVKLPIFCAPLSANQIVPVASFVIPYGRLPAVAMAVSTKVLVVVLKKPILPAEYSVNQILPLLSRTKSYGLALAVGTFHCFQAGPFRVTGVSLPIAFVVGSENQMFPCLSTSRNTGLENPVGSTKSFTTVSFVLLNSPIWDGKVVLQFGSASHPGSATQT